MNPIILTAGSCWSIYTRYGKLIFSLKDRLMLQPPGKCNLNYLNSLERSLTQKYLWYVESHEDETKRISAWKDIEKFEPGVCLLWIIKVKDYFMLIVDSMEANHLNEYRMFVESLEGAAPTII